MKHFETQFEVLYINTNLNYDPDHNWYLSKKTILTIILIKLLSEYYIKGILIITNCL